MTFGILALGFPVSEDLGGFAAFGGSQSHFLPYLPYLNAFLRWRLASWLWGSLFRRIWWVSQPLGTHSLTFFLIFPILMHSLGDVWHPGSGVPCFGGFGGFRSLWGLTVSLSSLSSYLNGFLRWRLASWLWGSLFRRIWGGFAAFGGSQRWRLASWLWGSLFRRIWGVSQPLGAHSLTFFLVFPLLMHSLGDVWHPGSGVPCFGGFGGFRSLWGLTVSLSSLSSLS